MPLANNFVEPGDDREGFVPVRVMFCKQCGLAQLGETVDPQRLYATYLYTTSNSETMRRHFDRLTKDLISEGGNDNLLEIGANDGAYLEFAAQRGFNVLGVDPARNLTSRSSRRMLTGFFGPDLVLPILSNDWRPTIILARHCFCHQEWKPFMEACSAVSTSKTLIAIEVPYAADLLRRQEWDSIYSEHTSYMSLRAMNALLDTTAWHMHAVVRYGVHGGALLIMLRRNDSRIEKHLSADEFMAEENIVEEDWRNLCAQKEAKIDGLTRIVRDLREDGKIVSAFGASAKCSVLINACGFTKDDISFVTDNSPLKPGRLVPGTDIPIINEAEMLAEHPDYSVMTAWNYRAEILENNKRWRQRGGKFILPTEPIEIV